ncbi:MAG TPA: hypothetical protein VLQ29_00965 [Candidatus Dormibacteraeota bacterium]|jgi:hypothetical protein|nr:hypothetical protein [Candidatus Dormibacteraeota bacterium]
MKSKKDNSAGASPKSDDSPKQDVFVDLPGASSNHGVGEPKIDGDVPIQPPSRQPDSGDSEQQEE